MRRVFDIDQTIHGLALAADGRRIAAAGPGVGRIFDARSGGLLTALPACRGHAYDVDFAPDGRSVAICFHGGHVWTFSAEGEVLRKYVGHAGVPRGVRKVRFSPDGARLASVGEDRTLRIWEVASGRQLELFEDRADINTVAWTEDGRVAIGTDASIHVIDVGARRSLSLDIQPTAEVQALAGGMLLSAWGGAIRVLDHRLVELERYPQADVSRLRASADGRSIFAASWQGPDVGVIRWSRGDGSSVVLRMPRQAPVWALALDEEGGHLFAGTSGGPSGSLLRWRLGDLALG